MREDWVEVELGEVLTVSSGTGLTSNKMSGSGFPVYGGNGITGYHSEYLFEEEKLIIGRVGVRCGVTHVTKPKSWVTDNALVVTFKFPFLNLKFLQLKLQFENLNKLSNSTAQPVISGAKIYSYPVKIPPLPIQRAIVLKIENLFASLDKGIADLKTAQEQLKIYRQAVLKKAFEGKLVSNHDSKDSPDNLDLKNDGKENHGHQENHNNQGSDNLPKGWKWVRLGEVLKSAEYGTSAKSNDSGLVPVLRMGNIQNGIIDWDDLKFTDDIDEIKKYKLNYNDVLFNRTNSPEHVGKTAIYKSNREAIFAGYLIRINYIQEKVNPDYLSHYLNSHEAKQYGNQIKSFGVNQSNINGTKLKTYPFPLPPTLTEQHAIVREIESRLSVCDKVEQSIAEALEKAEALRQSILKKAFEGRLLSEAEVTACKQEADYEPASELLKNIKAEKVKV